MHDQIKLKTGHHLKWEMHTSSINKKVQQKIHFLRQLATFHLPPSYTGAILYCHYRKHSYAYHHYLVWCSILQRKEEVATDYQAQLQSVTTRRPVHHQDKEASRKIISDTYYPANYLFQKLPSRKRFHSLKQILYAFFTHSLCNFSYYLGWLGSI